MPSHLCLSRSCLSFGAAILCLLLCLPQCEGGRKDIYPGDYTEHQRAAKLYFILRQQFNPEKDLIQPSHRNHCPDEVEGGCISPGKLYNFLRRKWIPNRQPIDADGDPSFADGHFLNLKYQSNEFTLMADFVAYLQGRSRDAVPEQVRKMILGKNKDAMRWMGDILPHETFLPPKHNKYAKGYVETDNEPFVLHKNNTAGVDALMKAGGAMPYFPEQIDDVREEEGVLERSKLFKGLLSWAMVLMGLALPLVALVALLRLLPPDARLPGLADLYPETAGRVNGPRPIGDAAAAMGAASSGGSGTLVMEKLSQTSNFLNAVAGMVCGMTSKALSKPTKVVMDDSQRRELLYKYDETMPSPVDTTGFNSSKSLERVRQLESENQRLKYAEEEAKRSQRLAELQTENDRLKVLRQKNRNPMLGYSVNV